MLKVDDNSFSQLICAQACIVRKMKQRHFKMLRFQSRYCAAKKTVKSCPQIDRLSRRLSPKKAICRDIHKTSLCQDKKNQRVIPLV